MPAPTFEKDVRTEPPRHFRFTLRTLFVVMTMVAAVIGLFIRHFDGIGFFFSVLVVLAGWCFIQGNRFGAVVQDC